MRVFCASVFVCVVCVCVCVGVCVCVFVCVCVDRLIVFPITYSVTTAVVTPVCSPIIVGFVPTRRELKFLATKIILQNVHHERVGTHVVVR